MRSHSVSGTIAVILLLAAACPALAGEQLAGPDASAQSQLPRPDPAFEGKIAETYKDATPSYPQPAKAPAGAPNVLIILLDDVGFGMCSPFGGSAPTPNLDKLADNGLTYTRFHTTALCSPTRGALLAGRNHSIATGVIIEMGTGFPGYTGIIPKSTALVSQMLRDNGYATSMFGKWHNTPEPDISPAGPFDRWPTGLGFDYFYGFNQGETHQYYPTLYRNTVLLGRAAPAAAELAADAESTVAAPAVGVPKLSAKLGFEPATIRYVCPSGSWRKPG